MKEVLSEGISLSPLWNEIGGLSYSSGTENRYRYNGKEYHQELNLGLYDYKARYYDPAIGRWNGVDSLAEDPNQLEYSPYAYTWNNPINLTDPDGNCPWCLGAIAGAATDYGLQVVGNLAEGKSLGDALTDVDGASIATSAALGATGVGLLSKAGKLLNTGKKVSKATQLSKNVKQGAKFEKTVEKGLSKTDTDIAKQITVKTKSGTKTRLDFVSKNKKTGQTKLTEAKSSQKAPLTKNQKKAFPEIAKEEGTVVGKGKGQFPGGTKIPPTKVDIIRPKK